KLQKIHEQDIEFVVVSLADGPCQHLGQDLDFGDTGKSILALPVVKGHRVRNMVLRQKALYLTTEQFIIRQKKLQAARAQAVAHGQKCSQRLALPGQAPACGKEKVARQAEIAESQNHARTDGQD